MTAATTERGSAPSAVLSEDIVRSVTGGVPGFTSVYTVDYGAQAAVAMVVAVSLVIVVPIFRRGNVSGLTAGAVKG